MSVRAQRLDFAEFSRRSKDECLFAVLVSVGDQDTAQDLVAEALVRAHGVGGRCWLRAGGSGVPWGLRHPQLLTVLAIANEAPLAVFYVLRVARAVQRRRPRIAAGSALVAAGSVARLRAASAEPLR